MNVTISGIDVSLFHVAAAAYGDATQWLSLAIANNLSDPQITGVRQLYIPPVPSLATGAVPPT